MRGNAHVRFGGRAEETDEPQGPHRASVRPDHSAASFMARAGYPLDWVGKQLGHSSITVTEQYRHFYPEQGAQLANLLDAEYRAAQQGVGVSLGSGRGAVVELTGS